MSKKWKKSTFPSIAREIIVEEQFYTCLILPKHPPKISTLIVHNKTKFVIFTLSFMLNHILKAYCGPVCALWIRLHVAWLSVAKAFIQITVPFLLAFFTGTPSALILNHLFWSALEFTTESLAKWKLPYLYGFYEQKNDNSTSFATPTPVQGYKFILCTWVVLFQSKPSISEAAHW